jgi:hypothetical protein
LLLKENAMQMQAFSGLVEKSLDKFQKSNENSSIFALAEKTSAIRFNQILLETKLTRVFTLILTYP